MPYPARNELKVTFQRLLAKQDFHALGRLCEQSHAADIAPLLNDLDPDLAWRVLQSVPSPEHRAEIFSNLDKDLQVELASEKAPPKVADLLEEMDPDDRVEVVRELDEWVVEEVLPLVAPPERAEIRKLAAYPEGTAGAVMTTDYATLPEDCPVEEAWPRLRAQAADKETIYSVYVVDAEGRLKGVVSLKDVVCAKPDRTIGEIMERDVVCIEAHESDEAAAEKIADYDFLSLPVVDGGRLVGIITVDDVIDIIQEEAGEDMYHYGAAGEPVDYFRASALQIARQRVGWLLLLVFVGMVSGLVMGHFEAMLSQYVAIAFFFPVLMDTSGNAGCQTSTVVVRGLATGEIRSRDILRILGKELTVALYVGAALAGLAAVRALLTPNAPAGLELTVAVAMFMAVVIAKSLGALLPILFKRLGFDPAVMSAPLITSILDVGVLSLYLLLARAIIGLA